MKNFYSPKPRLQGAARPDPKPNDDMLNIEEAACHLRVCTKTVRNQIAQGKLPAAKVGRQYRLSRKALDAHMAVSTPLVAKTTVKCK